MKYFLLHKPLGLSPQQAIDAYRLLHPEYQSIKLGSAGRLDPMAEGLMLVMIGEENKRQSFYIGLDKTYEVELLLGVSTDSYDLLGMPQQPVQRVTAINRADLDAVLTTMRGSIRQSYPPYSAVRVQGKPLYWWARQNRLHEVSIPVAERLITQLNLLAIQEIDAPALQQEIINRIALISGDFRQSEVLAAWDELLRSTEVVSLWSIHLRISCSSGTFVRGIVDQIGRKLGYGAVTRSIVRTKIGPWELKDAQRIK